MNWRKREDHPELFENGEAMLVAVPVLDTPLGTALVLREHPKCHWEMDIISIRCDVDTFSVRAINGDPWGWDWPDVEYYVPIKEVQEGLPKP